MRSNSIEYLQKLRAKIIPVSKPEQWKFHQFHFEGSTGCLESFAATLLFKETICRNAVTVNSNTISL